MPGASDPLMEGKEEKTVVLVEGRKEGRWENATCSGFRARGGKTRRGRWAPVQLRGAWEEFELYLIMLSRGVIKGGSVSWCACLFLTDLRRGENYSQFFHIFKSAAFYLFHILAMSHSTAYRLFTK